MLADIRALRVKTPLPQSSGYIHTEGDPTLENPHPKVIIEDNSGSGGKSLDPESKYADPGTKN